MKCTRTKLRESSVSSGSNVSTGAPSVSEPLPAFYRRLSWVASFTACTKLDTSATPFHAMSNAVP